MRRNKRNRQPDEGVCDVQHTVHSDELFVIRQHKRNRQPDEGVCDIQHTVHSDELFVIREHKRNGQPDQRCVRYTTCGSLEWTICVETWEQKRNKMCVIRGKYVCNRKRVQRPITIQMITANKPCVLWANDCWYTTVSDWWKHHRRVPLFSPCAMWFSSSAQHLRSVYIINIYT